MKVITIQKIFITTVFLLCLIIPASALQFTHGPYLVNQTETEVTVMWFTDVMCRSSVEYGTGSSFSMKKDGTARGIWQIGTRHEIRLTGLTPGQTYNYRAVSTEVTSWVAYYSTLGNTIRSTGRQFVAFDKDKADVSFYVISDVLSDAGRLNTLLNLGNWNTVDFGVFGGDVLADLTNENNIFSVFIDPVTTKFAQTTPIVFIRGNQEMNGSVSPKIYNYVPSGNKEFFGVFYHGPAFFLVFDSGQDTADASPQYGGLMRSEPYLQDELEWFKNYVSANNSVIAGIPFKIALAHQPDWGYGDQAAWDDVANSAGVNLLIAGHDRVYSHTEPGSGKNFHTVVVGQDQLCKITVSVTELNVLVVNSSGTEVDSFIIN